MTLEGARLLTIIINNNNNIINNTMIMNVNEYISIHLHWIRAFFEKQIYIDYIWQCYASIVAIFAALIFRFWNKFIAERFIDNNIIIYGYPF